MLLLLIGCTYLFSIYKTFFLFCSFKNRFFISLKEKTNYPLSTSTTYLVNILMQHLINMDLTAEDRLETDKLEPIYSIFIFVNTESGGKLGKKLMNSKIRTLELTQNYTAFLYFYIINQEESRKEGIKLLKKMSKESNPEHTKFLALAGGGDGTVNWLLTELIQAQVDFSKVIFGAFPLGTGNDFAKNLGWREYAIFENDFSDLKAFIRDVKNAEIDCFDIWDIEVESHEDGNIIKKLEIPGAPRQTTLLKRICNYFSFGMDARVGYDFDVHRSQSQAINYILYFLIGCFNEFRSLPKVNKIVSQMEEVSEPESNSSHSVDKTNDIIFASREGQQLKQRYRNIVAMNINYYMGGVSDIWHHAHRNGTQTGADKTYTHSTHHDSKIQFIAFKDQWSLGFQRYFRGRARKITQGTGPFRFQFEHSCKETYINFDGEYYKIYKPKSVVVRLSKHFEEFKLKVLRFQNNQSKFEY